MDTSYADDMAVLVADAACLLESWGRFIPTDERQTELDEVMRAANYKAFVAIKSNCIETANGSAQWNETGGCHMVRINQKLNRRLTRAEALALIAHEVSHLKRRDAQWHRWWVRTTQQLVVRLVRLVGHRWSPFPNTRLRHHLKRLPLRVNVWVSMAHEYRADADVIRWLGPDYALPLAGTLHKSAQTRRQRPKGFRWRTHPPLVRRYKALGVTQAHMVEYFRQQRMGRTIA